MNSRRDPDFVPRPARSVPELLPTIGHQSRYDIIKYLATGPCCVKAVAQWMGLADNAISNALDELYRLGLVEFNSEGKFRIYRLSPRINVEMTGDQLRIRFALADGDRVELLTTHRPIPGAAPHVRQTPPSIHGSLALVAGAVLLFM